MLRGHHQPHWLPREDLLIRSVAKFHDHFNFQASYTLIQPMLGLFSLLLIGSTPLILYVIGREFNIQLVLLMDAGKKPQPIVLK